MKTALDGGKKVKTQLFRRRGHRIIQKESYLTSKKLQGPNDPPPLDILGLKNNLFKNTIGLGLCMDGNYNKYCYISQTGPDM